MEQDIKQRNRTADLLKGVAVVLMIQVHLMELFATQELYDSLIGKISLFLGGPPAAPVFMAVMGYYVAFSRKTFQQSIIRGFRLVLLGLLLNIGLNFHLLIKIATGQIDADPFAYIFGVDILFLAGLSIIALAAIKHFFGLKAGPYLVALVLILLVQYITPYSYGTSSSTYIIAFLSGKGIWWSYFPFVPWFIYPLTGFLFYIIEKNHLVILRKSKWYVFLVTGLIVLVFVKYGIYNSWTLLVYYHHGFAFYMFTLSFLIFWLVLASIVTTKHNNLITRFLEWIGKNVTAAYVIQWLLIGNIATALYKTQNFYEYIFWLLIITLLTSAGTLLWVRIRNKNKEKKISF